MGRPILVVEDDTQDLDLLTNELNERLAANGDFRPVVAYSRGDDAISYLMNCTPGSESDSGYPCLVILDLTTPGLSGLEVLKTIRSQSGTLKRIPVVVLTSSTSPKEVDDAYEAGVNAYTRKPASPREHRALAQAILQMYINVNRLPAAIEESPESP